MHKRLWSILAGVVLGTAVPAHATEVLLATHTPSGTKVYAEVKAGRLYLKSIGPAHMVVSYNIDANANGVVDPEIDVAYGFFDDGALCPQKWLTEASWSFCGKLASAARASQEVIGDTKIRRLDAPVSEISTNRQTFAFKIDFWDSKSKARNSGRGVFNLVNGQVAAGPPLKSPMVLKSPATVTPAKQQSPSSSATPGFAPLGREFQVTAAMVTTEEGFFRKHYYDFKVRGKRGDRFKVAWRSTEPVNNEYIDDRGYDIIYPKGSTIFDLSKTMTVVLTSDGDHQLSLSQLGVGFPKRPPSNSLAPPSLEGRYPRAFIPFTLLVQKLN